MIKSQSLEQGFSHQGTKGMIFLKSLRGEHEFFFNAESAERRLRGIPQFPSFRAFRVKKVVNWTSDFLTVSENQPIPPKPVEKPEAGHGKPCNAGRLREA